MPNSDNLPNASTPSSINYTELTQFLLEPLLDEPKSLAVDCEELTNSKRLWIRVAFEQEDKGKVFGRGGRNLRAIETILNGATTDPERKIYLDVYGSHDNSTSGQREHSNNSSPRGRRGGDNRRGRPPRQPRGPKPSPQLRNSDEG